MKISDLKITGRADDGTSFEIVADGVVDLELREYEDFEVRGMAHFPGMGVESRSITLTLKSVGLGPSMTYRARPA